MDEFASTQLSKPSALSFVRLQVNLCSNTRFDSRVESILDTILSGAQTAVDVTVFFCSYV